MKTLEIFGKMADSWLLFSRISREYLKVIFLSSLKLLCHALLQQQHSISISSLTPHSIEVMTSLILDFFRLLPWHHSLLVFLPFIGHNSSFSYTGLCSCQNAQCSDWASSSSLPLFSRWPMVINTIRMLTNLKFLGLVLVSRCWFLLYTLNLNYCFSLASYHIKIKLKLKFHTVTYKILHNLAFAKLFRQISNLCPSHTGLHCGS